MASGDGLDLESLLKPISEDAPTGTDIREDTSPKSPYYTLKDARAQARERERMAEAGDTDGGEAPDWQAVAKQAPKILTNTAKDLEVAAWFTEAQVRLNGFAGLRDGFQLLRGLVDLYWDDVYPHEDEDGLETKVAPITGLNGSGGSGTLLQPLRQIALTGIGSSGPFSLWQYDQAVDISRIQDEDRRQKRLDAGAVEMDQINRAVADANPDFYPTLWRDLTECRDAFQALTDLLSEKCGADAPPSSAIKETLEQTMRAVRSIAGPRIGVEDPSDGDTEAGEADSGAPAQQAGQARGGIMTGEISDREEAFRQLMKVSEFFRKTEPHSPVSYMVSNAVRLGQLTLPQLMRELMANDSSALEQYFVRIGVEETPPDD